jgi:hypothetical protein
LQKVKIKRSICLWLLFNFRRRTTVRARRSLKPTHALHGTTTLMLYQVHLARGPVLRCTSYIGTLHAAASPTGAGFCAALESTIVVLESQGASHRLVGYSTAEYSECDRQGILWTSSWSYIHIYILLGQIRGALQSGSPGLTEWRDRCRLWYIASRYSHRCWGADRADLVKFVLIFSVLSRRNLSRL